jgi:hypothetical protein
MGMAAAEIQSLAPASNTPAFEEARYLRGMHRLVEKDVYAANLVVPDLSFSSFAAGQLRWLLRIRLAAYFMERATTVYSIARHEIFTALNKLVLNGTHSSIWASASAGPPAKASWRAIQRKTTVS